MEKQVITVRALNRYLKYTLDEDPSLQSIYIKGEVSNFNHHRSGHMYFTLKDDDSRISAVMFKGNNQKIKFKIENGMQVIVQGNVSIYEAYGEYQVYVNDMEPDGIGSLYLAYEQLKASLEKAGLFDNKHKKPLPRYPKHIGMITSPTGAAVRDMISTIQRRNKHVQISVIPAQVQGGEAAGSIVDAIQQANEMNECDLLLIGRGGGSIEDLWAFNEEEVVRAIFASHIPVISAVGHETDTTLSDFVADVRAATPTGAAELAVTELVHIEENIHQLMNQMTHRVKHRLLRLDKELQSYMQSKALQQPRQLIDKQKQTLDYLTMDLDRKVERLLERKTYLFHQIRLDNNQKRIYLRLEHEKQQLDVGKKKLMSLIENKMQDYEQQVGMTLEKLILLNPLTILQRGYALPYSSNKEIIRSVDDIQENEKIHLKLHDGRIHTLVETIERGKVNE